MRKKNCKTIFEKVRNFVNIYNLLCRSFWKLISVWISENLKYFVRKMSEEHPYLYERLYVSLQCRWWAKEIRKTIKTFAIPRWRYMVQHMQNPVRLMLLLWMIAMLGSTQYSTDVNYLNHGCTILLYYTVHCFGFIESVSVIIRCSMCLPVGKVFYCTRYVDARFWYTRPKQCNDDDGNAQSRYT